MVTLNHERPRSRFVGTFGKRREPFHFDLVQDLGPIVDHRQLPAGRPSESRRFAYRLRGVGRSSSELPTFPPLAIMFGEITKAASSRNTLRRISALFPIQDKNSPLSPCGGLSVLCGCPNILTKAAFTKP